MTTVVLDVQGVSKRYATYKSIAHRALSWFDFAVKPETEFRAVTDISFKLNAGESVAIIGPNGAGKSTLLKMITGTVRPTAGRIWVAGRINALLELGLGFNPELTGRQNVYMSGGMMGLSGSEIDGLIADIQDFAELGDFFEQPLRVYSSGMQARLAFAVATSVRPDILIVDEVLSVGDAYFQVKSFARFKSLKDRGAAVVLVSHDLNTIRAVCDRAILLTGGHVVRDGPSADVCEFYNALVTNQLEADAIRTEFRDKRLVTRSGTGRIVVDDVWLSHFAAPSKRVDKIKCGEIVNLSVKLSAFDDISTLTQGFLIRDRHGHDVYGTNTFYLSQRIANIKHGDTIVVVFFIDMQINEGVYSLSVAAVESDHILHESFDWIENLVAFEVIRSDQPISIGTALLDVRVTHSILNKVTG